MADRWSPLAARTARFGALAERSAGRIVVTEETWDYILVRGRPSPTDLAGPVGTLDVRLPLEHDAVTSSGDRHALRSGPDEWLLGVPAGQAQMFVDSLATQEWMTTIDVSAARVTIALHGDSARDIVAGACGLDLDEQVLGPGRSAQTLFARVPVIIEPIVPMPAYRIICRPSFARYLGDWILDAAESF